MSADKEEEEVMQCCASCGTAGGNEIKLKDCSACHLVKYCSVKCQRDHRPKHKKVCKKRAAELRDKLLFKQPESSSYGECPICCLPLSLDPSKSRLMSCCSNIVCNGCNYVNQKRELDERLQSKCPFCRKAMPKTKEEAIEQQMKRIEADDPVAMRHMGTERYDEGDYKSAFEYYTKAAALGNVEAHYRLSILYGDGAGVEKDEKREMYHAEEAAIGGHPEARHNLGCVEWRNGQYNRAVNHYIIAATLGNDLSLKGVKAQYQAGLISKENFAAALHGYQASIEATKSPQREEAYEFEKRLAERRSGAV